MIVMSQSSSSAGQVAPAPTRSQSKPARVNGAAAPPPAPSVNGAKKMAAEDIFTARQTCVESFVAIARHHDADLSVEDIISQYNLKKPCAASNLKKIAKAHGFATRSESFSWRKLKKITAELPALAVLANKNCVIITGFSESDEILIVDPLARRLTPLQLDSATFGKSWNGHVILVKPKAGKRGRSRGSLLDYILPWRWG